ncbi:UvrD-helicase domain-containing protein [Luteipulveratus halotolerans]|uniref:UvrD-helicase domain-containing protein n=1 Tax=Luteipulveratus halotolerans TaxID=1631356 RepID=UPI000A799BD8|nr:UvrD-helicase domain-containing protein [Luteipulveratus halotolerans]
MTRWGPSVLARIFRGVDSWDLQIIDGAVVVEQSGATHRAAVLEVRRPELQHTGWWTTVTLRTASGRVELPGARRSEADQIRKCILREQDLQRAATELQRGAEADLDRVAAWSEQLRQHAERPVWLAHDTLRGLDRARPALDSIDAAAREPRLGPFVGAKIAPVQQQIQNVRSLDLDDWAAARNEQFLAWESQESREFFATVEKTPLTGEQVKATVCFDNRVRVIASAGSGKTSIMVARAAYAARRELAQPAQILMLAFNKRAAEELSERVGARLGDTGSGITASTFHALGLRIIGEATGKKPSVPNDITKDKGIGRLAHVVDRLRDADPAFRRDWDLFRLVFGRPLAAFDEAPDPEAWDRDTAVSGFKTLAGEVVRSQEEVMIANWLFLNGVPYEYERSYEHDTADPQHGQYTPDFYYPQIDAYHEHWAVNAHGQAPPHFAGYAEGMQWKRATHQYYDTTLLETTSASIRNGSGFEHLARELQRLGQDLDEDPFRPIPGEEPITDAELLDLFRTFMVHAKGNQLDPATLDNTAPPGDLRTQLFLRLYATVVQAWNHDLAADRAIDFEDMINQATDHLEAGRWTSPYRLVLVDEMQDTSLARARLVAALTGAPNTYLLAVGDDWQSINRFAGSDLSVMSDFADHFGPAQTVYLTRTFRSPQTVCDIAGRFVTKNPAQLDKQVHASNPGEPTPVRAIAVEDKADYDAALDQWLTDLDNTLETTATVLVLGRYNKTEGPVSQAIGKRRRHLQVRYSTVHKSKGDEADYVVIAGLERRGFPSTIQDDPLLDLAMPGAETHPYAEERRLFYVALTRTRREVLLLTRAGHESPFLLELVGTEQTPVTAADGTDATPVICPRCKINRVVQKTGKYGPFFGCTGFPSCRYTSN